MGSPGTLGIRWPAIWRLACHRQDLPSSGIGAWSEKLKNCRNGAVAWAWNCTCLCFLLPIGGPDANA